MYKLKHEPKARELKNIENYHNTHYVDYCKVWFNNGEKGEYENNCSVIYYNAEEKYYIVDFYNPIIGRGTGQFGAMGIIRAKRIIQQIKKDLTNKN